MGRGIAYRHQHFMLIDELELVKQIVEPGYCTGEEPWAVQVAWDDFKDYVQSLLVDSGLDQRRFTFGYDHDGGAPCVYMNPRVWYRGNREEEVEYNINRDATRFFNRLIKAYPTLFSVATSAWTSRRITRY